MLEGKELSNMIQEYQQRLEGLEAFFGQLMFDAYIAFPLYDRFGPAISDAEIEAIVITEGSRGVAQESMLHSLTFSKSQTKAEWICAT